MSSKRDADTDNAAEATVAGQPAKPRRKDAMPDVESFDLEHHVFYWMTQVASRRDRQIAAGLRRYRVRVPEWRILALLKARQSLPLGEAGGIAGLDHTTTSRLVARMERAGRIVRLSDAADMRVTRLKLTAAGHKLFDQIWPIVDRLNREALARLPEGAAPLLCLALSEIERSMDESWRRTTKTKKHIAAPEAASRRPAARSRKQGG